MDCLLATLLALDPSMNKVSFSSLSGSHLGPSLLTGLPALLTRIRSVLGRPRPGILYSQKNCHVDAFLPDLMTQLFLETGELLALEEERFRT